MMRIGYGRISARDQSSNEQHEILAAAGCDQVFIDKANSKPGRRPELGKALMVASRSGDQLVVTALDRLGYSVAHLGEVTDDLRSRGVNLVVLSQDIDTSTPDGQSFFDFLDLMVEFENALAGEKGRSWLP
jgi:DNA invertase Pin-like site-specific DNA recombinase